MKVKVEFFDKQLQALDALTDDVTNEVCYGGGARGGKSWLGCMWVIMCCMSMPGSSWMIGRQELAKLRDTTQSTFFKCIQYMKITECVDFNQQRQIAFFENGSSIKFAEIKYRPSDPLFDRLGSYDLTGCFLDEAQEIHPMAISVLRGRFSNLKGDGWRTIPKALYTCNPSKNWIYKDYYLPDKKGILPPERKFIRALVTDNPTVSIDYINNLKRSDEITRQRLLYGNFEYDDDDRRLTDYDAICDIFTNEHVKESGRKYITCDVARQGRDMAVICSWDEWKLIDIECIDKCTITELEERILYYKKKHKVATSCIVVDEDGVGGGVKDHLRCKGFIANSRPFDKKSNYKSLRAELMFHFAGVVNDREIYTPLDDDKLREEITQEIDQIKQTHVDADHKKLDVLSSSDIKNNLGRSPDLLVALSLRSYFDLKPKSSTRVSVVNMS